MVVVVAAAAAVSGSGSSTNRQLTCSISETVRQNLMTWSKPST